MRKGLIFLLVVAATTVLFGCGKGAKVYDFDARDTIVVGLEADYAPYNWATETQTEFTHPIYGRNDYADGYDVQIAKLIAEGLGKRLVIKAIDWKGLIPAVKSGEVDLIIAGMTPTTEREKSLLFTEEYYRADPVIVLRKDSSYANSASVNDFNDAKVVAQLETIYEGLVTQLVGAKPQTSLESYSDLLLAIKSGTSDAMIAELPVAIGMTNKDSTIKYIRFSEGNGFDVATKEVIVSIGLLLKNTDLRDRINVVLAAITQAQREQIMEDVINRQ